MLINICIISRVINFPHTQRFHYVEWINCLSTFIKLYQLFPSTRSWFSHASRSSSAWSGWMETWLLIKVSHFYSVSFISCCTIWYKTQLKYGLCLLSQYIKSIYACQVQSLENNLDELRLRLSFRWDIKTVISYVSPSHGWTTTQIIYSWLDLLCIGRAERLSLVRRGVVVFVYLSKTAHARCLILKKSRGIARLR